MQCADWVPSWGENGVQYNPDPEHPGKYKNPDYYEDWELYKTIFKVGKNYFKGIINIKLLKRGRLFKDLTKIEDITDDYLDANGNQPLLQIVSDSSVTSSLHQEEENYNKSKKNKAKQNFALRAPVEETKDLIAVHNATEKNVRGLLGLGGLPMPSIAIIKAAQGHDDFGEYSFGSIVGRKWRIV